MFDCKRWLHAKISCERKEPKILRQILNQEEGKHSSQLPSCDLSSRATTGKHA